MRVRRSEGLAIHIGPKRCAGIREDVGEASVGECIGQPLSRESDFAQGADAVTTRKATSSDTSARVSNRPCVV